MVTPETSRKPCPRRILDHVGGSFGVGVAVGSAYHFLKGIQNSPRGQWLINGARMVHMNAPRVGGIFSICDCSMVYLRQKEDHWNKIISGAATGAFSDMKHGLRASARSALVYGFLFALIEGAAIKLNKHSSAMQDMPIMMEEPATAVMDGDEESTSSASNSGSGSLFGEGKKKEEESGGKQD